jgi:hypothetical protein
MHPTLQNAAGHPRAAVTMPGYHAGRPPRNKGRRYPPDPPTVEEIIAVMRSAGTGSDGIRLRALIVVLWRAGLRISEALALAETDMDARRGAVLIRRGKGDKRREVGMDAWAWEQLEPAAPPHPFPGRLVLLRDPRPHRRTPLGSRVRAPATHSHRRSCRSATPARATPAPARARSRDGARRRPARHHPEATRACPPRGHLDLSPRNRQLRDHRHRPRPTTTHDPGQRRPPHDAVTGTQPSGRWVHQHAARAINPRELRATARPHRRSPNAGLTIELGSRWLAYAVRRTCTPLLRPRAPRRGYMLVGPEIHRALPCRTGRARPARSLCCLM